MKIVSLRVFGAFFLAASSVTPQLSPHVWAAPVAPSFTSQADKFSIWLPGKPEIGSQTTQMPRIGKISIRIYSVRSAPAAYIVMPMSLPGSLSSAATSQFLDGVQRGFTMSTGAKLLSSKKISLGGIAGREILVQAGPNLMRGRFFAAGKKSYQIVAIAPKAGAGAKSAQINKVLDSFRILR